MCGGGYSSADTYAEKVNFGGRDILEKEAPKWRLTGQHLVFYGSANSCKGSTTWCRVHCIRKTKPFPFEVDDISSNHYSIVRFINLTDIPYADDFRKAKYVTLMGTGTLDIIGEDVELVIKEISKAWPLKMFRFYLRSPIEDIKIPVNAKVIFSADKDTDVDYIDWAIKSLSVSAIGVVKHKDNKMLLNYLKPRIHDVLDCDTCIEMDCIRRSLKKKYLVHMNFIGEKNN